MNKNSKFVKTLELAIICLILMYIQHFQLNYSASVGLLINLRINIVYQLIGMMTVAYPFLLFLLICKDVIVSLVLNSILITALSIANHFTVLYHGSPVLASDLYSFTTAMNVISEYSFIPDDFILRLLAVFAIEILIIFVAAKLTKKKDKTITRVFSISAIIVDSLAIWMIFLSPWAMFKENLVTFSWSQSVKQYSYEVCFGNSVYSLNNKFIKLAINNL